MGKKGRFIVIEGGDGSGKATQAAILVERLTREGRAVQKIDFPQYGARSAYFIERYLNGDYGTIDEVGPYRAAYFFALDRFDASARIRAWRAEGNIVIANRYTTSSMGHLGGSIADTDERARFFSWLEAMEYEHLGIPRPDVVMYLHVPAAVGQRYVAAKETRQYLRDGAKHDLHEKDLAHLERTERAFLELGRSRDEWITIECAGDENLLPKEQIHEMVWNALSTRPGYGKL